MRKLRSIWKSMFDVRKGEGSRTLFMALYLLFVLWAYYILRPVSSAMFLNRFDIDKLPYLNMLIAGAGGLLAYLYSKVALKTSLHGAVTWAMAVSVLCLIVFWWILRFRFGWMLYVFNVWVKLFSIVLVSQGWLVAANVFDARSAKRLYGLLGLGAVFGAAFGGTFTRIAVKFIGSRDLLLASAVMVALAYVAFRSAIAQRGVSLSGARAAETEEGAFSFRDILISIGRHRHLQLIIAIIMLTFIVDTLVDFQFRAMAKQSYPNQDQLTAFLGTFEGVYLNLVTFPLQFFLTAAIVRRLGVGGTLQIMPVSIAVISLGTIFSPGLLSTAATRLTEAGTRYTLNRTGMELLYLPLPAGLRNRTKAFVDIFMDRMGRGLGGALLALLPVALLHQMRYIALFVAGSCLAWILLSRVAQKEYIRTVRNRLATRGLDLENARITAADAATIALLEQAAASSNPRQVCYALSLLAEAPSYDPGPVLSRLANSPSAEIRGKVYEIAWFVRFPELVDQALSEIRTARAGQDEAALKAAVNYALSFAAEPLALGRQFLDHANPAVAEGMLEALLAQPEWAQELITREWLTVMGTDPDPRRRCVAAFAIRVRGDHGIEALHQLLEDRDPRVAAVACQAAAALQNRVYVESLARRLADARVRGAAIEALASYGARISGTLGDILEDRSVPLAIRRQIPRVLKLVPEQRNVDVLLKFISDPDLSLRAAALKALNRLRERDPHLNFGEVFVARQIFNEARHYFELHAALAPLAEQNGRHKAVDLLARTLDHRIRQTIERVFRLLGLCYPQREIYAAYLAVNSAERAGQISAGLEFLDTVLERSLRRIVLPLLDSSGPPAERGRELFGIEAKGAEAAIRELIRCGDPWLMACSVAAAAELKIRQLVPDIRAAAKGSAETAEVARSAVAALA